MTLGALVCHENTYTCQAGPRAVKRDAVSFRLEKARRSAETERPGSVLALTISIDDMSIDNVVENSNLAGTKEDISGIATE